jgi:RNA polymerase sigma-70 factor (ECF subfamily)
MDITQHSGAGTEPVPEEARSQPSLSAEQVYHDYAPRVYHVARQMVSETDAEDVTQDVLLQVIRKLPTFRGESALPTWLHRITVNAALSHRRKRAVREEHRVRDPLNALLEEVRAAPPSRGTIGPDTVLEHNETRRLIEAAIANLPPLYRDVFILADVEGLSNAAIADTLGVRLPAVKSRLHRARSMMREELAPHFEDCLA